MGDFNARKGSLEDTVGPSSLTFSDLEDKSLNTDADVSFPKCVSRDITINTYGRLLSNAAINFCHNNSPRAPRDFHRKLAPTLGLLHPNFCTGGRGLFGVNPDGRAFVCKRFFAIFVIFIVIAKIGDIEHFGV